MEQTGRPIRVLIVEDNANDAFLLARQLLRSGFQVEWERVETRSDYAAHLKEGLDLVLCDYRMPAFDALEAIAMLRERRLDVPFIVVTGAVGEETAAECIKQGADDFLLKDRLARLGRAVEEVLEIKDLRLRRQRAEARFEAALSEKAHILERISDAFVAVDLEWRITYWNREAEKIAEALAPKLPGKRREDVLGKSLWDTYPDLAGTVFDREYRRALAEQVSVHFEERIEPWNLWVEVQAYPSPDGLSIYFRDITDRKRREEELQTSLKQKDLLLKEVHHRVKNNMQILASLLSLQGRGLHEPQAALALRQGESRVHAMALMHERLYQSDSFAQVDLGAYVRELVANLWQIYQLDDQPITLEVSSEPVPVKIDSAIPCGLIVHELVTNAIKHAFPEGRSGTLRVEVSEKQGWGTLLVSDNGIGLPEALPEGGTHLGLGLVELLVEQIGGEFRIERDNGARFTVTFPITPAPA